MISDRTAEYNSYVVIPYFSDQDRISKTKQLKIEMTKRKKLSQKEYKISLEDNCVVCRWFDKSLWYWWDYKYNKNN